MMQMTSSSITHQSQTVESIRLDVKAHVPRQEVSDASSSERQAKLRLRLLEPEDAINGC